MSFEDVAAAQRFISLLHGATGVFANVQSPSIANIGDTGFIDSDSASFQITGHTDLGMAPAELTRDYVFCSQGVLVNGQPYSRELAVDLSVGITFEAQGAAAIIVLSAGIRSAAQEPVIQSASQELVVRERFETTKYAVLLVHGAFTAAIRLVDLSTWSCWASYGTWRALSGDVLLTPILVLYRGPNQLRLPSTGSVRVVMDAPERSPSPKVLLIDLVDTEATPGGHIPEADPSPTQLLVYLWDVEKTEGGRIPDVEPGPQEISLVLVDVDQIDGGYVPDVDPNPRQVSVDLVDVENISEGGMTEVGADSSQISAELLNDHDDIYPTELSSGTGLQQIQDEPEPEGQVEVHVTLHASDHYSRVHNLKAYKLSEPSTVASAADIQPHVDFLLKARDSLEELTIDGVHFSLASAPVLADVIPKLSGLKYLVLSSFFDPATEDAREHDQVIAILCKGISLHSTLLAITLESRTLWSPPTFNFLGGNLQLKSLTVGGLNLSRETDAERFDSAMFTWVSAFRREDQEPTLRILRLQSCKLASPVIARLFTTQPQLEVVEITSSPDSEFTKDSVGIVLLSMKECKQLRELTLSVPIRRRGSVLHPPHSLLADNLTQWPHLRLLRLPTLPSVPEGVLAIWETLCLGVNSELEILHLPGVDSAEALVALRQAVVNHLPRLTHLNISPSPQVSPEDVKFLEQILLTRSSSAELRIRDNAVVR